MRFLVCESRLGERLTDRDLERALTDRDLLRDSRRGDFEMTRSLRRGLFERLGLLRERFGLTERLLKFKIEIRNMRKL